MDDTNPTGEDGYRLASLIQVAREGRTWHLAIDGERFPFLIDRVASTKVDPDECPSVTITLLAEQVQIDNTFTRGDRNAKAWPVGDPEPKPWN